MAKANTFIKKEENLIQRLEMRGFTTRHSKRDGGTVLLVSNGSKSISIDNDTIWTQPNQKIADRIVYAFKQIGGIK